jgi:simple sugar transport system permease protein
MLFNSIEIAAPFLIAALGALLTERSGVLNIALEGLILTGAFFAYAAGAASGSLALGLLAGCASAVVLAAVLSLFSLRGGANIFIAGLAANLAAAGLIPLLSEWIYGTKGVVKLEPSLEPPVLFSGLRTGIGVIDDIFFGHSVFVYAGLILAVLTGIFLNKTTAGLRMRAAGMSEEVLTSRGISARSYRGAALLISGAACGLAGAALSLRIGAFVPNMSGGRGWIALVVVFIGFRRPYGILAGALLFGFAENLTGYLQQLLQRSGSGTWLWSFPYLLTAAAFAAVSVIQKRKSAGRRQAQ